VDQDPRLDDQWQVHGRNLSVAVFKNAIQTSVKKVCATGETFHGENAALQT
jgi:hypothetical protein